MYWWFIVWFIGKRCQMLEHCCLKKCLIKLLCKQIIIYSQFWTLCFFLWKICRLLITVIFVLCVFHCISFPVFALKLPLQLAFYCTSRLGSHQSQPVGIQSCIQEAQGTLQGYVLGLLHNQSCYGETVQTHQPAMMLSKSPSRALQHPSIPFGNHKHII